MYVFFNVFLSEVHFHICVFTISFLTSEKLRDALQSAESTTNKLNKDITALRLEYEDNLKQLANLQKEKAQISGQLESTQDTLENVQRDIREMRSEYENKLLDSQQSTENEACLFISILMSLF